LRYPVFMQRSAGFETLVGDYGALPRVNLPEDYARDVDGLGVVKTVKTGGRTLKLAKTA
jgi:hypothetical protein